MPKGGAGPACAPLAAALSAARAARNARVDAWAGLLRKAAERAGEAAPASAWAELAAWRLDAKDASGAEGFEARELAAIEKAIAVDKPDAKDMARLKVLYGGRGDKEKLAALEEK